MIKRQRERTRHCSQSCVWSVACS